MTSMTVYDRPYSPSGVRKIFTSSWFLLSRNYTDVRLCIIFAEMGNYGITK
jgi:hypothetical protein